MSKAKRFLLKLSIFIALASPALGTPTPMPQMSAKCPPFPPTNFEELGYYMAARAISDGLSYRVFVPAMCADYAQVTGKYLSNTACSIYMGGGARAFMDIPAAMACYQEHKSQYGDK